MFGGGGKITPMDLAVVSRQIATMLSAGVPLVQSLQLIAKSNEKAPLRILMTTIGTEVASGTALSQRLRGHPKYFDDLYCNLVDAGEQSGALESIYDRISMYKEKSEQPAFTLFVLGISDFMQAYWYIVIIIVTGAIMLFKRVHLKSQKVRDNTDKFVLKIPVVSTILDKAAVARFARTLSTTFAGGIPLVDALISAADASGNYVYRTAINNIRTEVMAGMQMNVPMKTTGAFPDMVSQVVMFGEESGDLDGMLSKVADIYEQQVDDAVDALTSLLEPMIMVVLGVVVGGGNCCHVPTDIPARLRGWLR